MLNYEQAVESVTLIRASKRYSDCQSVANCMAYEMLAILYGVGIEKASIDCIASWREYSAAKKVEDQKNRRKQYAEENENRRQQNIKDNHVEI